MIGIGLFEMLILAAIGLLAIAGVVAAFIIVAKAVAGQNRRED